MTHSKIELGDVLNFFEYEKVRDGMRRRVMELKRARRVPVGRYLSFLFAHSFGLKNVQQGQPCTIHLRKRTRKVREQRII